MSKTLYVILQCKENNYIETVESIKVDKKDIVVYADENQNKDLEYTYFNIGDKTLAYYKNHAIKYAREKGYSYVYLIENDIVIKDMDIFNKYTSLMDRYSLGVIFYGFYGPLNWVMGKLPNPSLEVKLKDETYTFIRMPTDVFIGINLNVNTQYFNEKFNVMEFNEYLKRCFEYKCLTFNGFYFDVFESWKYFDYCKKGILPKKITKQMLEDDKKYVQDNGDKFILKMSTNVNEVLNYLKKV